MNVSLNLTSFVFWNDLPSVIRETFVRNKLGLPNFRVIIYLKSFGLVPFLFESYFLFYEYVWSCSILFSFCFALPFPELSEMRESC